MTVGLYDDRLNTLKGKLDHFGEMVSVEDKARRIVELESHMTQGNFWDDQERAQEVINELKAFKAAVDPHREINEGIEACRELQEMADGDDESLEEVGDEVSRLEETYEQLEISLALGGEYDASDVYLSIQPGAGGVEAMDWSEMLFRMYKSYCDKNGYKCDLLDYQPGEEAGLKSCTLAISGPFAYGYLKSEMGTHRLVRMSPFNAQGKRQTSFAAVEVTPELPEAKKVSMDDLDEAEFRIDTYRASGAGGQHVNKTDSAVRITHIPTNTVTSCQTERSQVQNKQKAWNMMVAKLQQLKEAERLDELKDLMGDRGTIGWGHQIRSYVLQPTQLITDLRSRHKEANAQSVLDGDLQPFINHYLRWRLQQMGS